MVQSPNKRLTLEDFIVLTEGDVTYEFVNGEAVRKYKNDEMSAVATTGVPPVVAYFYNLEIKLRSHSTSNVSKTK
jgi:hypothetical protein